MAQTFDKKAVSHYMCENHDLVNGFYDLYTFPNFFKINPEKATLTELAQAIFVAAGVGLEKEDQFFGMLKDLAETVEVLEACDLKSDASSIKDEAPRLLSLSRNINTACEMVLLDAEDDERFGSCFRDGIIAFQNARAVLSRKLVEKYHEFVG